MQGLHADRGNQAAEQDAGAHAHGAAPRPWAQQRPRSAQACAFVSPPAFGLVRQAGGSMQAGAALLALAQTTASADAMRIGMCRADGEQWELVAQVTERRLSMALRVGLRHLAGPASAFKPRLPLSVPVVYSGPQDHAQWK